jgi:hypothetical protein
MNNALKKLPEAVVRLMHSHADGSVRDPVWRLSDVETVLRGMRESEVAILGGDVYEEGADRLLPTYDSWYCDREPGESYSDYAQRSWAVTWRYFQTYLRPAARPLVIGMVLSDEPTAGTV